MKISKINPNNIMFLAIRKEPTSKGYKVFDGDVLTREVSLNIQQMVLTTDTFNKSGNKTDSCDVYYPHNKSFNTNYEYNSLGKITRQTMTNNQGGVISELVNDYWDNGEIKTSKLRESDTNKTTVTKYDKNGRKISTTITSGSNKEKTDYLYDDEDALLEEITYEKEKVIYRVKYEYGQFKKPIRESHYGENSKLVYEELFDEKTGQILKSTSFDDGKETSSACYEYSKNHKLIKETRTVSGQIASIKEYNPETENLEKETIYKNGIVDKIKIYGYDEQKRPISCITKNSNGNVINMCTFDYENNQFIEM